MNTIKLQGDRAWGLPAVFAVAGIAAAIGGALVVISELRGVTIHGPSIAGAAIAVVLGGLIGYLGVAALRESGTYLLIDLSTGRVEQHVWRKTHTFQLADLGVLDVVPVHQPGAHLRRGPDPVIWELRAACTPEPLFRSSARIAAIGNDG